jgi:hypothetical protein
MTGAFERVKMTVLGDDPLHPGGDGAIGKRVIIRIGGDEAEMEWRLDVKHVPMELPGIPKIRATRPQVARPA